MLSISALIYPRRAVHSSDKVRYHSIHRQQIQS